MVTDEKRPTPNMITGCQKNYQIINSLILETSFFSEIHCYQFKVLSSVDLILSDYQFKNALHVWFTTVPFNLTLHGIKKDITIFLSEGGLSSWYSYCSLLHKTSVENIQVSDGKDSIWTRFHSESDIKTLLYWKLTNRYSFHFLWN